MNVVDLPLAGLKRLEPRVFPDPRGFFLETFRSDLLKARGIDVDFMQDNHSRSLKNTMRGLHFQRPSTAGPGQAKLVRCSRGAVFDVAVDIRPSSPTFLQWHGEILDDESHRAMFIPVGFAHGFCVLSDVADFVYKCTSVYDPKTESGFKLDDADVQVRWPIPLGDALLSARDQNAPSTRELTVVFEEMR